MRIHPSLALAILAAQLINHGAFAGAGSATLAAGESRIIRAGTVYRDIKVCNDVESRGDLLAAIGGSDPVRLSPGMCQWDRGDSIILRNESTATVASTYKVSTCSEPRGR